MPQAGQCFFVFFGKEEVSEENGALNFSFCNPWEQSPQE
jgi:hypothetical protein